MTDEDFALALQLQSELFEEDDASRSDCKVYQDPEKPMSLVDPYWELTDPTPDMRAMFLQFNDKYFWGILAGVEVKWSSRMTLCAGLCKYEGRGGLCSISLSVPLLKLRPRKDLVETLLHEMIHAYLFVTDNNKDHDGHGPEFHKHMYRLNKETGTKITVYHNFHDEVDLYKQHWWRCNGPCQSRKPYFGHVKRSMNRAPSKNDTWWAEHQRTCGGTYTKIKEPEGYGKKKTKSDKGDNNEEKNNKVKTGVKSMDIRIFGGEGKTLGKPNSSGSDPNKVKVKVPPTATITSGVLTRPDTDAKPPWKDKDNSAKPPWKDKDNSAKPPWKDKDNSAKPPWKDKDNSAKPPWKDKVPVSNEKDSSSRGNMAVLPGASTPTKGVKNKPISQGGNVPFSKVKKKSIPVPDFSDSDDDSDLFASVPEGKPGHSTGIRTEDGIINTRKESDHFSSEARNSSVVNSNHFDNNQSLDKTESSKMVSISAQKEDLPIDPKDVRAMLRKVWGQVENRRKPNTDDDSIKGAGQKRESTDTVMTVSKRIKLFDSSGNSNVVNKSSGHLEQDTNSFTNSSPQPGSPNKRFNKLPSPSKIASPIEKLFNKIKDKQNQDNKSSGATSSGSQHSVIDETSNCDRSTLPVIGSGDVNSNCDTSPCPVCNQAVPVSSINDHLDLCLTLKAIG